MTAKTLETSIEMTRKEMENPTEVEVELKKRLGQLTDHLIQKQAQVCLANFELRLLGSRLIALRKLNVVNFKISNSSIHLHK
ncbi:unnamed protein product [Ilex paraguariensis]|uniref:Uncharacterized protein n=1 Tax=Ilex paraguariensis TaxID=185542 RepID=A0ABC8R4A1_9AQUA